ncbi:MAG: biotin--[acetyl-CoA-carboxylase] ligase [Clostridiales bacterium]|jgi:BirA family biotin operon repressor/biotin-[acetyl-CoA-carboxylase] ligase|nr:biotin--[acetyl-CoA-carboxylase] ligase [Clostridiales bacterium]
MIYKTEQTASTNTAIREGGFCHLDVVAASVQTQGRGRGEKKFVSNVGGLYMSMLIDCAAVYGDIGGYITPLAGCAVSELLLGYGFDPKIKWVNDVFVGGKKICGILAERFQRDGRGYIAVGIGLNVNNADFGEYSAIATSMSIEAKKSFDLNAVLSELTERLIFMIGNRGKNEIIDEYRRLSLVVGKYAALEDGTRVFVRGIDGDGRLEAVMPDGQDAVISSGSITPLL